MISYHGSSLNLYGLLFVPAILVEPRFRTTGFPLPRIADGKGSQLYSDVSLFVHAEDKLLEALRLRLGKTFHDKVEKCELADPMQDDVDQLCAHRGRQECLNTAYLQSLLLLDHVFFNLLYTLETD